jgi:hypothetical protein
MTDVCGARKFDVLSSLKHVDTIKTFNEVLLLKWWRGLAR